MVTERWYAGVGSRGTDVDTLARMRGFAVELARRGYGLRSGAAEGADAAFEAGARAAGGARAIYLPWAGFNQHATGSIVSQLPHYAHAREIAQRFHPGWRWLSQGAQKLHARNVMQVLGDTLTTPAAFVLMAAPALRFDTSGRITDCQGGTGMAVRIATAYAVPVYALNHPPHLAYLCEQFGVPMPRPETDVAAAEADPCTPRLFP